MLLSKKIWLYIYFLRFFMPVLLGTKLILKKKVVGFLNHHNYTVFRLWWGVTKLPSKIYQFMTNLNP
jgi:hypothetical protein